MGTQNTLERFEKGISGNKKGLDQNLLFEALGLSKENHGTFDGQWFGHGDSLRSFSCLRLLPLHARRADCDRNLSAVAGPVHVDDAARLRGRVQLTIVQAIQTRQKN